MIKARAIDKDGLPLVILGFSEGNLTELRKGRPMKIDLTPLGLNGTVVILYGKTEEKITRDLALHFKLPS